MIHIDLQKWPHPNEEADFRISETILKIGVYNTDWRIYRVAKLKNRPPHLPHTRLAQDLILYIERPSGSIVVANVSEICEVISM